MLPADLPLERLEIPPTDRPTLVVLTGNEPRHDRFALRILDTFGEQVLDWYRIAPGSAALPSGRGRLRRARGWWSAMQETHGSVGALGRLPAVVREKAERRRVLRARERRQRSVEVELFGAELESLRRRIGRQPISIADPNAAEFVERVRQQSPWLLLSLGGPLYRRPLLGSVRGAALNQHAGHSPEYRGTNTTDWALYHRDLAHVANTVHVTVSGADAGGILRRSQPCLLADDSPETVFARVVALGTELMVETVGALVRGEEVWVAPQPRERGRTYLSRELEPPVLIRTARDFADGWLGEALDRATRW